MDPFGLLWLILILLSFQPLLQQQVLAGRRQRALARLARARGATVVTLIHRQETLGGHLAQGAPSDGGVRDRTARPRAPARAGCRRPGASRRGSGRTTAP